MKNCENIRLFKKSFIITITVLSCLIIGIGGVAAAYENTVRIAFGEYKKAFEINSEGFKILDFEVKFR